MNKIEEQKSPRVSVLMAVYNGMPHLVEAVESVQNQTLTDWQMVIVNDGSSDDSAAYIESLSDDRILLIHQKNQGLARSLNNGLAECIAPLTARLDADDVCEPTRLAQQVAFLETHADVGLAGTQVAPLGESRRGKSLALPCDHETIFAKLLEGQHAICHSSIIFRTKMLQEIGGYWEHTIAEDWDVYLRIGEQTKLANVDEMLLNYRVLPGSLQGTRLREMRSHISFACENSRRRTDGKSEMEYDEFESRQKRDPLWKRVAITSDIYARAQYRQALGDTLGRHRWRGYARMTWAAACSPQLTAQRVIRVMKKKWRTT